jgi:hypothetical protein
MLNLGMLETGLAVCAGGVEVEEGSMGLKGKRGEVRRSGVLLEKENAPAS